MIFPPLQAARMESLSQGPQGKRQHNLPNLYFISATSSQVWNLEQGFTELTQFGGFFPQRAGSVPGSGLSLGSCLLQPRLNLLFLCRLSLALSCLHIPGLALGDSPAQPPGFCGKLPPGPRKWSIPDKEIEPAKQTIPSVLAQWSVLKLRG